MRTVLIPEENEKDLKEIPQNIVKQLDIRPVRWIDQVLEIALLRMPEPPEDHTSDESGRSTKPRSSTKRRVAKKGSTLTKH